MRVQAGTIQLLPPPSHRLTSSEDEEIPLSPPERVTLPPSPSPRPRRAQEPARDNVKALYKRHLELEIELKELLVKKAKLEVENLLKEKKDSPHHYSAPAEKQSKKKKRTSEVHTSNSSTELTCYPAPQHSNPQDADPPVVQGPQLSIPPSELPQVSTVVPRFQPSTAPLLDDGPLIIHHLSVEEFQQLYHVVDDMLWYINRRQRPYSLALGRHVKHKRWERSDRPQFTETVDENGRVHVDISNRVGVSPPLYNVDTSLEPQSETTPRKRARK
ncbi:uncharacterized protein LOC117812951 isoform X1 [Xyrichtys novacula]|uniref:Uncharacterized protein LOC117812951 isoform X1 n=1 Tax=Xyrichtys novacula TaxID=13765 RepID=A0AAV1HQN2_XYRNO|nr:uncharacterized protein LOC117812951 isoform X1 [Xyrichtys novacula]